MPTSDIEILVADDDPHNREIIADYLADAPYRLIPAVDGAEAWALLEAGPTRFHAVLLDRMMPHLDGMEVLARIKAHPDMTGLPVIIQTARAARDDLLAGMRAGAWYYLTKPFDQEMLESVLATAVADCQRLRALQRQVERTGNSLQALQRAEFRIRTLHEARGLAALLASACPVPARAVLGLSELLINAVEHGNLGIDYDAKGRLLAEGRWEEEIARRLAAAPWCERSVDVTFERNADAITVRIRDQGAGFDWARYAAFDPERIADSHGRGIMMARALSLDAIDYVGNGSEVMARIAVPT